MRKNVKFSFIEVVLLFVVEKKTFELVRVLVKKHANTGHENYSAK